MTATRYKEILEKIEELKYYNEIRRRAEDLDAGNGKVHTIAEMEKMLEVINDRWLVYDMKDDRLRILGCKGHYKENYDK